MKGLLKVLFSSLRAQKFLFSRTGVGAGNLHCYMDIPSDSDASGPMDCTLGNTDPRQGLRAFNFYSPI